MIANVKIAPIEKWCEPYRIGAAKFPLAEIIAGHVVEIETSSLGECVLPNPCKGKRWRLVKNSLLELGRLANIPVHPTAETFICEHMLEVD